jgi:hypothetical protein
VFLCNTSGGDKKILITFTFENKRKEKEKEKEKKKFIALDF